MVAIDGRTGIVGFRFASIYILVRCDASRMPSVSGERHEATPRRDGQWTESVSGSLRASIAIDVDGCLPLSKAADLLVGTFHHNGKDHARTSTGN